MIKEVGVGDEDSDVVAILEEARTRVRTNLADRRTAVDDEAIAELQKAAQDVNANAQVNPHLPLLWEDPILGRLRAYAQRVVRRLLRWYINPIIAQQNAFNASTAWAVILLVGENVRLRRELADLAQRIAALESHKETQ